MHVCESCAHAQQWHACTQPGPHGTDAVRMRGPMIRHLCDLCGRDERCYRLSPEFQAAFPPINPHLHRQPLADPALTQPCTNPERTQITRSQTAGFAGRLRAEQETHQPHSRYAVYTQPVGLTYPTTIDDPSSAVELYRLELMEHTRDRVNRNRLLEALEEFRLEYEERVGDDPS